MSYRVALVDDHRLFREGLRALLASQPDLQVVGEAAEPAEACALVDAENPDLVVLDVLLGTASGVAVARELLRRSPRRRVLMLSMVLDEEHAAEALEVGALGYAGKAQALEEVLEAIRTVAAGRVYLPTALSRFVVHDYLRLWRGEARTESPLNRLTRREREIFDLIVGGGTTVTIAAPQPHVAQAPRALRRGSRPPCGAASVAAQELNSERNRFTSVRRFLHDLRTFCYVALRMLRARTYRSLLYGCT